MQQDKDQVTYCANERCSSRRVQPSRQISRYNNRNSVDRATLVSYIAYEHELSELGDDEDGCISKIKVKNMLQWIWNSLKFRRIRRYLRPKSRVAVLREPRFWSLSIDRRSFERPR